MNQQIVDTKYRNEKKNSLSHAFWIDAAHAIMPQNHSHEERQGHHGGKSPGKLSKIAHPAIAKQAQDATRGDHHLQKRHDLPLAPGMGVSIGSRGYPAQIECPA